MEIDTKVIQAELDALVNPVLTDTDGQPVPRRKDNTIKVVVKVDRQMTSKVGIDYYDQGYRIRLNRPRIHNQGQLDSTLAWVKKEIGRI